MYAANLTGILKYFPKSFILHSFQQYTSFSCFTSSSGLGIASLILTVQWRCGIIPLWIYLFLKPVNVEHLFMFLLAVHIFTLVRGLFKFLPF